MPFWCFLSTTSLFQTSFHLSFSLRFRRLLLSSHLCGKALMGISGTSTAKLHIKKEWSHKGFPFLTACGNPQICSCSRKFYTSCGNKKSAKRLPCLYMVSSDTRYNPKQRMPRISHREPEPAAGTSGADISGMSCLSPFPIYRYRIKINYGIILTQHLVSCQLNNTISSVFSLCISLLQKIF